MRRWLTILLLLSMPLQLSWAAVSAYCQHETGAAAQHFGHHDHEHKADADRGDNSDPKAKGGVDADCGLCHAGGSIAIFGLEPLPAVSAASDTDLGHRFRISSPPPSLPERPNWADLA